MSVPLLVGAVGGVGLELLSAAALEELLLAVHGPDVLHHSRGSGGRVRADRALPAQFLPQAALVLPLHVGLEGGRCGVEPLLPSSLPSSMTCPSSTGQVILHSRVQQGRDRNRSSGGEDKGGEKEEAQVTLRRGSRIKKSMKLPDYF